MVIDQDTDWGGVSLGSSMLLPHSAGSQWSHSRAAHEFGHVLGLDDAFSTEMTPTGVVDTRYRDDHCIMSYATTGSCYQTMFLGRSMEAGPSLNGVYANQLGGIPMSRLNTVPALNAATTVMLAPLGHPEEEGDLLIQISPTLARRKTYWVELHDPSRWDRAVPNSRLAIHETRAGDGGAYLLDAGGVLEQSADEIRTIDPKKLATKDKDKGRKVEFLDPAEVAAKERAKRGRPAAEGGGALVGGMIGLATGSGQSSSNSSGPVVKYRS